MQHAIGACRGSLKRKGRILRFAGMRRWRPKWPRARLFWVMILIALIAVSLRLPVWFEVAAFRPLAWWETYRHQKAAHDAWKRREKAVHDAWSGPIAIRVTRQDDLGSILAHFKAATTREGLGRGLDISVDPGGLREAGQFMASPLGIDLDAKSMPAREFLEIVLKPLGLACKLEDGAVMVTSEKSLAEPIDYGHHGEVVCKHGERVRILNGRGG